ncbi:MAG: TolC family outer membrane protein [Wenzhouxiangella sp.]
MTRLTRRLARPGLLILFLAVAQSAGALNLTDAVERAEQFDPRLAAIEADFLAAREDGEQLLSTRRTQVNAFANLDYQRDSVRSDLFGDQRQTYLTNAVGVEVRQPLFRLDWFERGRQAEAIELLAEAEASSRRQAYWFDLADRYFNALSRAEDLALAEAEAESVRESLLDTRARFEAEAVAATDLREAEARDDLARARLLAAEQGLEDAVDRLEEAVGPVQRLPVLGLSELDLDAYPPLDEWLSLAREQSPELMVARSALEIASAERRGARSDRAPQLDLVGSATRFDQSDSLLGQRGNDAVIGLQFSMPLAAGGALRSSERQAAQRERSAQLALDQRERELERQVRDAWRAVRVATRQVSAFEAAVRSAEVAEEATRNGFDAGTRTITDVLNARSATVQAQRDLSQARFDRLLADLLLKLRTGQIDRDSLIELDTLLVPAEPHERSTSHRLSRSVNP